MLTTLEDFAKDNDITATEQNYLQNGRDILAGKGFITMSQLIEDVSRLDFIKDLHTVRIGVVGKDNKDTGKGTDEL